MTSRSTSVRRVGGAIVEDVEAETVTGRAASSNVLAGADPGVRPPPSTLIALTCDGTCWIAAGQRRDPGRDARR